MANEKARIGPKDLGIDLSKPTDATVFRWLVACQLFGARISQEIAARAFGEIDRAGLVTPRKGIGPTAARIFLREMAPIWKL